MIFDVMETLKQFIKFGIVGISNTIIGYLIYALSLKVMRNNQLGIGYDVYIAQLLMYILSVAWSYYWNNRFVFKDSIKSKKDIILSLMKTYVAYGFTSLILSEVLLVVWIQYLKINDYLAPILSLVITVPLNFILQK